MVKSESIEICFINFGKRTHPYLSPGLYHILLTEFDPTNLPLLQSIYFNPPGTKLYIPPKPFLVHILSFLLTKQILPSVSDKASYLNY